MRLFAARTIGGGGCCVLDCEAPAQDRIDYRTTFGNELSTPPVRGFVLALPLCEAHGEAYQRVLPVPDGGRWDSFPAGAVAQLLLDIGETLREEEPDALELIAPLLRDWLSILAPQAPAVEALERVEMREGA